jgi:hypothetical protein
MPSAALSRLLPEPWAFFLDRSLGGRLVFEAGSQMAAAIVTALPAIKRELKRFHVPFIARISADGDVSVFESAGRKLRPPKRIRP